MKTIHQQQSKSTAERGQRRSTPRNKLASVIDPIFKALVLTCLIPISHAMSADLGTRAKAIFGSVKNSVVQVKTIVKGSELQTSYGSGFYVSDDGLVMTNYHVVSDYALDPRSYEIEYSAKDGEHGSLSLLAFDVLHDLALLRRKGATLHHLRFHTARVFKGELLFSLGNPDDLGLSIVQGVYNGLVEHSFYDLIHFTGPINSGMSGGPVVDRTGEVVGINDATMGEERGFLIPAQAARELLSRWAAHPVAQEEFQSEIVRQLKLHSAAVTEALVSEPVPVQPFDHFSVPGAAAPFLSCMGGERKEREALYSVRVYDCSGDSDVYVSDKIQAGNVFYVSKLFNSDRLDAFRFGKVLEADVLPKKDNDKDDDPDAGRANFSRFVCEESIVDIKGMPAKAALCMRSYRRLSGLYDLRFKATTLRPGNSALVFRLSLSGFAHDDGIRVVRHYMDALKWNG